MFSKRNTPRILNTFIALVILILLPLGVAGRGPLSILFHYPFPAEVANILTGKTAIPITIYTLKGTPDLTHPFNDGYIMGKMQLPASQTAETLAGFILSIPAKCMFIDNRPICFIPHHAIEFELSGKRYMFIICFECHMFEGFCDGKPLYSDNRWIFQGSPDKFNALLDEAKIPREKRP